MHSPAPRRVTPHVIQREGVLRVAALLGDTRLGAEGWRATIVLLRWRL